MLYLVLFGPMLIGWCLVAAFNPRTTWPFLAFSTAGAIVVLPLSVTPSGAIFNVVMETAIVAACLAHRPNPLEALLRQAQRDGLPPSEDEFLAVIEDCPSSEHLGRMAA